MPLLGTSAVKRKLSGLILGHWLSEIASPGATIASQVGRAFRYLSPEASRKAGFFVLTVANWVERTTGIATIGSSHTRIRRRSTEVAPIDMSVVLPGFGALAHPVGLGAGFERDGTRLNALALMGISFAEIGSLVAEPAGTASPVKASLVDRSVYLSPVGSGFVWPSVSDATQARSVVSRVSRFNRGVNSPAAHSLKGLKSVNIPCAINFEIPMPLGSVRATAQTVAMIEYLLEVTGKNNDCPVRDFPVVLSVGHMTVETVDVLRSVASEFLSNEIRRTGLSLWVKLGPGLSRQDFELVVSAICECGFNGIVVGSSRLVSWPEHSLVSGAPALAASNALLEWAWGVHRGALPMIGSGGVISGEDAFQKIVRGASAVEIMTALWFNGPLAAQGILAGLESELRRCGARSISECIGTFFGG